MTRRGDVRWLRVVLAAIVGVFAYTVGLREPWRGHLARGDQYVTAQTLRFARAWHRDGLVGSRLRLVLSPPTTEYAGHRQLSKWGLPGHHLLVRSVLAPLGLEPTVARLMELNLAIHLVLALSLAVLAYLLAIGTWPERRWLPLLVSLHTGLFTLLLPPLLYWGQHLSCQYFTILPLIVFCVGARWMRVRAPSPASQRWLDGAIAICVLLSTLTEFLFWLLVPYQIGMRLLRTRMGWRHTTDPWVRTLLIPFALGVVLLALSFIVNAQLGTMLARFTHWTSLGETGDYGGLKFFILSRLYFSYRFYRDHVLGAYGLVGVLSLATVLWLLARRSAGFSGDGRGVLVDLLLPTATFSFVLAPHQAFHTFAAMKFAPFVTLAWTIAVPFVIVRARTWLRWTFGPAYIVYAAWHILPATSDYRDYFAEPELEWEREARFLREHVRPSDLVFSPTTEIRILPPQRMALSERAVHYALGPLDMLDVLRSSPDSEGIAIYGPAQLHANLGANGAEVYREGDLYLSRFSRRTLRRFLMQQPYAGVLPRVEDVLKGAVPQQAGPFELRSGPLQSLPNRVAMHTCSLVSGRFIKEILYWQDEAAFVWRSDERELAAVGGKVYSGTSFGTWELAEGPNDIPGTVDWGNFITGLFERASAATGGVERASWGGYEVARFRDVTPANLLRERAPSAERWDAYLLYARTTPVALALGTQTTSDDAAWIATVFDEITQEIALPGDIHRPWGVRKANH